MKVIENKPFSTKEDKIISSLYIRCKWLPLPCAENTQIIHLVSQIPQE